VTVPPGHLDPTDLDSVRRAVGLDSPASRLHPVAMSRIVVGRDALAELPGIVAGLRGAGPVAVVTDAVPMRRGDADLKSTVETYLEAAGSEVIRVVLGSRDTELHADAEAIAAAVVRARGCSCIVSVGSGTICDVAKEVGRELGVPQVVVQTANSVNAFSDDMAVLLIHGVKRTVPSRWPDALVIDLETVRSAPPRLNRAGVGELVAMFTAPADWRLAAAVGLDDTWDRRVVDLFRNGADALLDAAPRATSDDLEAHRTLAELMTLSGLALGIAGRTAPISGTEHTVSHLLDMAAAQSGRSTGLHGAQVGVAALAVSVLWDRLLASFDPERLLSTPAPAPSAMEARIGAAFRDLDPSGAMAAECWSAYSRKLTGWEAHRRELPALIDGWDALVAELRTLLGAPPAIAAALRSAGAAATFDELDPPATRATAVWALLNGHLMRDRFTIADLAFFGGAWSEDVAAEAIETAAVLAAAAAGAQTAASDAAPTDPAVASVRATP
jgi:glycerol-1-phosphate dehydrogenase [NAD(P)+]